MQEEREEKARQYKKWLATSIVTGIIAVAFIIAGALMPSTYSEKSEQEAKDMSQLSASNEGLWRTSPNAYGVRIYRNRYVYNCSNVDFVIYNDNQPEFIEFGPYKYLEQDNYYAINYTDIDSVIGQSILPGVMTNFSQSEVYNGTDPDDAESMTSQMYFTNQAFFKSWYRLNQGQEEENQWRVYMTMLYQIIYESLGNAVITYDVHTQMQAAYFSDETGISNLIDGTSVTSQQSLLLYNDPYYGLSSIDNYARWDDLLTTDDEQALQRQQVWLWELRTYFGFSYEVVAQMQTNWNTLYQAQLDILINDLPTGLTNYPVVQGVAYWQWALSYVTNFYFPDVISVTQITDTTVGYPEYYFWLHNYCNPAGEGGMSQTNYDIFSSVYMYRNTEDPTTNMEFLFSLNGTEAGSDPIQSSLFNVETMQQLIALGQSTPNIIEDPSLIFRQSFQLSQNWTNIAARLNLADDDDEGVAVERAYAIWLWLYTNWNYTLVRTQDKGNFQMAMISQVGAPAFENTMTKMQLEFPMFIIAQWVAQSYIDADIPCLRWYEVNLGLDTYLARNLCSISQNFTFANPMDTAVALTNVYMYQDYFNSYYGDEFTSITQIKLNNPNYFYGDNSQWQIYFGAQQSNIYEYYSGLDICTGSTVNLSECPFSNLTNNQWFNMNPLFYSPVSCSSLNERGYVSCFENYTEGWITPEYGVYLSKNGYSSSQEYNDEIAAKMYALNKKTGIYNKAIFFDKINTGTYTNPVWSDLQSYLRWATQNFGLSSLLTRKTPQQLIEGYTDPYLQKLNDLPVYMGGDKLIDPVIKLAQSVTQLPVGLYTGQDDYQLTRKYGLWMNQTEIVRQEKTYDTQTTYSETLVSPWATPVMIDGTDGLQFSPALSTSGNLYVYCVELARNCEFEYQEQQNPYEEQSIYVYKTKESFFQSETTNSANANYNTKISGTSNLTTVLGASSIATQGHYYDLGSDAIMSAPVIKYPNGTYIRADEAKDTSSLGVEPNTGITLQSVQRIFVSMVQYTDELSYQGGTTLRPDSGWYFPLGYTSREFSWNQDQVSDLFGQLNDYNDMKTVLLSVFLAIGFLFLIIFCVALFKTLKLRTELGDTPDELNHDDKGTYLNQQEPQKYALDEGSDETGSLVDHEDDNRQSNLTRGQNMHGQGKPLASLRESYE